jgi:hypothetical protein
MWFFIGYGTFAFAVLSIVHFLLTGQHPAISKILSFFPSLTWQTIGLLGIALVIVGIVYIQYSLAIHEAADTQAGVAFGHEEAFGMGIVGLLLIWIQVWSHDWEPLWHPDQPYLGMSEAFFFWSKWAAFLVLASIASYFGGYWAILLFPTRIPGAQRRKVTAFRIIIAVAAIVGLCTTAYLLYASWFPLFLSKVLLLPASYTEGAWLPTFQFFYWLALIALISLLQRIAFRGATETQQGHAGALEHAIGLLVSIVLLHAIPWWIYSIQDNGDAAPMAVTYAMTVLFSLIAFSLSYKLIGNVFLPQIKT